MSPSVVSIHPSTSHSVVHPCCVCACVDNTGVSYLCVHVHVPFHGRGHIKSCKPVLLILVH